jgi:hypothetical protein
MQLVLQATHGIVSGQPTFFKRAFGDSLEVFERILLLPHHFIFNRDWYENHGGRPEFEEYTAAFLRLSAADKEELIALLSSTDPRGFHNLGARAKAGSVRSILRFYVPIDKASEARIWNSPRPIAAVPDDERVEDAGLSDDPFGPQKADDLALVEASA